MTPKKRFCLLAGVITIPSIVIWTSVAKTVLTAVASYLGVELGPLLFFVIAMAVNFVIFQLTLGRTIHQIKHDKGMK